MRIKAMNHTGRVRSRGQQLLPKARDATSPQFWQRLEKRYPSCSTALGKSRRGYHFSWNAILCTAGERDPVKLR